MKRINKKGFGLVMAIMIVTVLVIMSIGFFQITDQSNRTVGRNVRQLSAYWAAESASNYNVHWWINQPREVRTVWPYTYEYGESKTIYKDDNGLETSGQDFEGAPGTAVGDKFFLHASSLTEGNTLTSNSDLENFGDYKLVTVRYKGPRVGAPDQAVWILDSYAWNPKTGETANIVLANVWNYIIDNNGPWDHSEVISATNMGLTGFRGVKGRFNRQDIRYGPCYFGDIIHFDYTTSNDKRGPTFWGMVSSASEDLSSYNNGGSTFSDLSSIYAYGLYLNKFNSQAAGIAQAIISLKGGYRSQVDPIDLDNTVWSWDEIEKYGKENKIWFPRMDSLKVPLGKNIKAVLTHKADTNGKLVTRANIWVANPTSNPNQTPTWTDTRLSLAIGDGGYNGIAVPEEYGSVYIEGVSAKDFTLATQRSAVFVNNDFCNYEMVGSKTDVGTKLWLEEQYRLYPDMVSDPWDQGAAGGLLTKLHAAMETKDPEGHLAIIAAVDVKPEDYEKGWSPIFVNDNVGVVYTTAAMLTNCGELGSTGTSANTTLTHYNIGPVMVLDQQEIMSGPSDTAQKFRKVYIQDKRYVQDPTGTEEPEPLPPLCGYGPDSFPGGSLINLNPSHTWSKLDHGTTKDWREIVWRNLPSTPQ